jgi:hypothetical protein
VTERAEPPVGVVLDSASMLASGEHRAYYVTTDSSSVPEGLPSWQVYALAADAAR